MRAVVVICAIAGCGDSGLLLDITPPATMPATSVEVFLPSDTSGAHMGLPGARQTTPGTVYSVAEHVTAKVTGGHARILLQPGAMESVPAMLVLAYDANHTAVAYAVVSDPNGPITFRHTQSDELKIDLSPITEVPASTASPAPASAPRLVRWSAPPAQPPDDPNGACIAVLREDGTGDFFSPPDDQDCDGAHPECDDHWYLKPLIASSTPPDNPLCARDDRTPVTMMACRIGDTGACSDNVGDCTVREPAVCAPAALCDECNTHVDQVDMGCATQAFDDEKTFHLACTFPVQVNTGGATNVFCQNTPIGNYGIDLANQLGAFSCSGLAGFYQPPLMPLGSDALALLGTTTATVGVACPVGTHGLSFTLTADANTTIDPANPDTKALIVLGIKGPIASRTLVLPFVAHLAPDCTTPPHCEFVPGMDNGTAVDDTIWQCAGGQ